MSLEATSTKPDPPARVAPPRPDAVPARFDPIAPLRAVLDQVDDVLAVLDQDQYVQNPVGPFNSSVGGHIRHCLDHLEALIGGAPGGFIDYDKRQRGTSIEHNRNAAAREVDRLQDALRELEGRPIHEELIVCLMLSGEGPAIHWQSTLGREIAFVLSHTIHHGAMIAGMVKQLGAEVPEGFGLAPSTIAYRTGR